MSVQRKPYLIDHCGSQQSILGIRRFPVEWRKGPEVWRHACVEPQILTGPWRWIPQRDDAEHNSSVTLTFVSSVPQVKAEPKPLGERWQYMTADLEATV